MTTQTTAKATTPPRTHASAKGIAAWLSLLVSLLWCWHGTLHEWAVAAACLSAVGVLKVVDDA